MQDHRVLAVFLSMLGTGSPCESFFFRFVEELTRGIDPSDLTLPGKKREKKNTSGYFGQQIPLLSLTDYGIITWQFWYSVVLTVGVYMYLF